MVSYTENTHVNLSSSIAEQRWLQTFFTEKSGISIADREIQAIIQAILASKTVKKLVIERCLAGNRFLGWTVDGSRGCTDISGDIKLAKTGTGSELFTLAYECINSRNSHSFKKIGIKYAFKKRTSENRDKFALEILGFEAQAMYLKCALAEELRQPERVRGYYLTVYNNACLKEAEKIEKIKVLLIEKGVAKFSVPAFEFYRGERYDEFMAYFSKQIELGLIS